MDEQIEFELIDGDAPAGDYETPPKSFLKECEKYWRQYDRDREKQFTDADKAFYGVDEEGQEYFYIGKTRIKVIEHFPDDGPSLCDVMERMILSDAREQRETDQTME